VLQFSVTCQPGVSGTQTVGFGVPFPRGFLADAGRVRIEAAGGAEIPSDVTELARWRHLSDPRLDGASLRSVLVSFRHDCVDGKSGSYQLRWGAVRAKTAATGVTPLNIRTYWGAQSAPVPGEHPATDNYAVDPLAPPVAEPKAWAALPASWLMKSLIRGPVAPISDPVLKDYLIGYAKTAVNDVHPDVIAFESDNGQGLVNWSAEVEGWLFDRPFALWNVYVQTGDVKWLRHAHRASQYYASMIARDDVSHPPHRRGAFLKRGATSATDPGDPKYSHAGGLFAAYLLTGDAGLLDPIRAAAEFVGARIATRLFPYEKVSGLWTERQLAAALNGAVYAYEATGDKVFADRARAIVEGMKTDVTTPPAGYPSDMRGVLLHRPEVHEGTSQPDMVMSPWMSALLVEALTHYHVLSEDTTSLEFLSSYAQFVATRGLYGDSGSASLGQYRAAWYIAGLTAGYSDGGIEADIEHNLDVYGLLVRGRWARARLGLSVTDIDRVLPSVRAGAMHNLAAWHRSTTGLPRHRLAPTRKFGWWFGTTHDTEWFAMR
jgi:hypothetical protein